MNRTSTERRNARMHKIFEDARRLKERNAYPELVSALRECIAWGCNEEPGSPVAKAKASARALLVKLGEAKP